MPDIQGADAGKSSMNYVPGKVVIAISAGITDTVAPLYHCALQKFR